MSPSWDPEKIVEFAGAGQCGHTIVAACLDAHPNMMIADEKRTLHKAAMGKTRDEIFHIMYEDSRLRVTGKDNFRMKIGKIPGQYQGTFKDELKVLGNKHGWDATSQWRRRPGKNLLNGYLDLMGKPVYIIHTHRNPFDQLTSWAMGKKGRGTTMDALIDMFIGLDDALEKIYYHENERPFFVIPLPNEKFCKDTMEFLVGICATLELDAPMDWLQACRAKVNRKPHRRIHEFPWTSALQARVYEEIIDRFPWCKRAGYSFDLMGEGWNEEG